MARGRFISKDISLDLKVASLSDDTSRLLFTWLIAHLDCEGRMYGEASIVKSQVFPRLKISDARVEKYLSEMEKLGLIFRYSDENYQQSLNFSKNFTKNLSKVQYLYVPNFEKHQIGLRKDKEASSVIPPPPSNIMTKQLPTNDGVGSGKGKLSRSISKDKIKGTTADLFREYAVEIQKLREEFPDLLDSFDSHIKNCIHWWDQQKRQLKDPVKAARNWLIKERSNLKSNQPGNVGRSRQISLPGEIPSDDELG